MATVITKSTDAAKPVKRTTRSSIRQSLNLASVGKALADVMNKEGKESERRKESTRRQSALTLGSKDSASKRASIGAFRKGFNVLEPVPEGQSKGTSPSDQKTVTQAKRTSTSLQRAGRTPADETGSKVTSATPPQSAATLSNRTTTLRPRKPATGSALPKYRPRSVIVEGSPRETLPIRIGTRRKHSSSEEDREGSSLGANSEDTTPITMAMAKTSRPISPIPRRAAKSTYSPSVSLSSEKFSPPRKSEDARRSSVSSTPPRRKKTQRGDVSPVVKKTGLPRPSTRGDSPRTSSSSPRTPTSIKSTAARYVNDGSNGRDSPSPLRSSSIINDSLQSRRESVKKESTSFEHGSNQNTPTALAVINKNVGNEEAGNDSVDDIEMMLAAVASPSAPTPAIPRFRATLQVPPKPETPSRFPLRPPRSSLRLSVEPPDKGEVKLLHSSRRSTPIKRPVAERNSIANWQALADLSLEINADEMSGGLITELDLPTIPGLISPSPSMLRMDSEGLEHPTPLNLPSPGGYTSISQMLLPTVTPSPAPMLRQLRTNSFRDINLNSDAHDFSPVDSGNTMMLKLQLASVENMARERLAKISQLEDQMQKLKESRKKDEHELLTHVNELEERLHETLAVQERERELAASVAAYNDDKASSEDEESDSHAACHEAMQECIKRVEGERRQVLSDALSELADRERAERACLLLQIQDRQRLAFATRDAQQQWVNVHEIADGEFEAIRASRETLAVLRAGLDFFEAQIHISRAVRIPLPAATKFHLA